MLLVVEVLQEFHTMIFGYPLVVHTDHKNWTFNKTLPKSAHVLYWHLAIEEFVLDIHYVLGEKNVVADALSQLPGSNTECKSLELPDQVFDLHKGYKFIVPITFCAIAKEQVGKATHAREFFLTGDSSCPKLSL